MKPNIAIIFGLIFALISSLALPLLANNAHAADDTSESMLLVVRLEYSC